MNFTLNDEVFDGELKGQLETDPFGIGHYACGMIEGAIGSLRAAAKAVAASEGSESPGSFDVTLDVTSGVFNIGFTANAPVAPAPIVEAVPEPAPADEPAPVDVAEPAEEAPAEAPAEEAPAVDPPVPATDGSPDSNTESSTSPATDEPPAAA